MSAGTFKLSKESDKLLSILLACALGAPDTTDGRNAYVLAETNLRGRLRELERALAGIIKVWEMPLPDAAWIQKLRPAIDAAREVMHE